MRSTTITNDMPMPVWIVLTASRWVFRSTVAPMPRRRAMSRTSYRILDRVLADQGRNAVTKEKARKQVVAERRHKAGGAGEVEFVRAFVLKLTGNPSLADDLVQETLLRAHKSEAGFKGGASRTSWLCAIALNVMRDHFRATARRPKQVSDLKTLLVLRSDEALEDDFLQREMDSCIRQYVLRLPERQRDVVALHDIAGLTHREVSSTLGISQSNSRILLHRGRVPCRASTERSAHNRQCRLLGGHSLPGSQSGFFLRFSMWPLPRLPHISGVS